MRWKTDACVFGCGRVRCRVVRLGLRARVNVCGKNDYLQKGISVLGGLAWVGEDEREVARAFGLVWFACLARVGGRKGGRPLFFGCGRQRA